MKKTYAVLGLGKFGGAIARELSEMGCDVIAVDINENLVKEFQNQVSYAVVADVTDIDAMRELGISEVDAIFISIADELESSIMAALVAKELGVSNIIAKAASKLHGKLLNKIGVNRVVYPEKEMGIRLAKNIVAGNFLDMIDLSSEYTIVELTVPKNWVGRSLLDINVRRKYGINIVALKIDDDIKIDVSPDYVFRDSDVVIVVGKMKTIGDLNAK